MSVPRGSRQRLPFFGSRCSRPRDRHWATEGLLRPCPAAQLYPMPAISQRTNSLGTENAFVVLAEVTALQKQGKDIIMFSVGQPDFPTPEHVQNAAIEAIRGGKHGY